MTPDVPFGWGIAIGATDGVRAVNSRLTMLTAADRVARRPCALAARLVAGLALAFTWSPVTAQGLPANITPEQLEILRSLPEEERNALIESVLGTGTRLRARATGSCSSRRLSRRATRCSPACPCRRNRKT